MEKKDNYGLYMVAIVAIVAIVGLIMMSSGASSRAMTKNALTMEDTSQDNLAGNAFRSNYRNCHLEKVCIKYSSFWNYNLTNGTNETVSCLRWSKKLICN